MKFSYLLFIILLLSVPMIVLSNRYLTFHFNVITINFYRFMTGALFLFALYHQPSRFRTFRQDKKGTAMILGTGVMIAFSLLLSTMGLAITSAVTSSVISVLSLPLTVLLALVIFSDERKGCLRSLWISMGVLSIVTAGYVFSCPMRTGQNESLLGIAYLFASITISTGVTMTVKNVLARHDAMGVAVLTSASCTATCLGIGIFTGTLQPVFTNDPFLVCILFGSGMFGIWSGVALVYRLTHLHGIIPVQVILTLAPPLVGAAGWIILSESMSRGQMVFGLLMILPILIIIRNNFSAAPRKIDVDCDHVAAPTTT